jgi:hypothetical protein
MVKQQSVKLQDVGPTPTRNAIMLNIFYNGFFNKTSSTSVTMHI